jgi:ABC-type uncharacterized transport system permease subunit
MDEKVTAKSEKKWEFTKTQSVIAIVIGSLLLAASIIISTQVGTTAHTVKVTVGFIGVCVLFVGVWRRPMKAKTQIS